MTKQRILSNLVIIEKLMKYNKNWKIRKKNQKRYLKLLKLLHSRYPLMHYAYSLSMYPIKNYKIKLYKKPFTHSIYQGNIKFQKDVKVK